MKLVRPLGFVFLVLGASAGVVAAYACDQAKSQGTSATAASNTACSAATCPSGAKGASTAAINAAFDHCSGKSASATTASMAGATCGGKNASTAGMTCSGHQASAMAAGANCSAHEANAQHMCTGAGSTTAANVQHANCTYCRDLETCAQEMRSLGAVLQVVSLKNGVMYVYTTDPSHVRAVQSAMARHKETSAMFASTGEDAHLCDNCRALRGASASGKLTREVVNIDGGCLTLMTSNDPAVVARIHELAGVNTTRVKS